MTPCRPLKAARLPLCATCDRLNDELPHDPEQRPHTVVIDGTVTAKAGMCLLHEARAVPVGWWNREEEFA